MNVVTYLGIAIGIAAVMVLICIGLFKNRDKNKAFRPIIWAGLILTILLSCISFFFVFKIITSTPEITIIPIESIETPILKNKNQNIKYINKDSSEKKEITIQEIKYDTNGTYIEKQHYEWCFLYGDHNILHIKNEKKN